MNEELNRLQLILNKQIQDAAHVHFQMETLIMEYDHAALLGQGVRCDETRVRYHDLVDLHLDNRATIATLTNQIENARQR